MQSAPARPPNILLVMTDQQRFDSLGCTGAGWVRTPALDRLASQGTLFDCCYATNPICTPSRASLFTGKHLPGHGVYKLHDVLPSGEVCFTERLRARGYHTALFGKLHVSGRLFEEAARHPHDGFDLYEWCMEPMLSLDSPYNGYSRWLRKRNPVFHDRLRREGRALLHHPRELHFTHWAAERAVDYVRQAPADRPFFCMVSVFDPHNPYEGYPPEMMELVDRARIPAPVRAPAEARPPRAIGLERAHSYLGPLDRFSDSDIAAMRAGYHASIALVDLEVARILEALEARGLAADTLVAFTSDHGDMLGDHDLLVKGAFFYDPSVRVPLILRWPGRVPAGSRTGELVQLHDLAATFLSAAGFAPAEVQGWMPDALDLAPVACGAPGHAEAVSAYRNSGINDRGTYWDPPLQATMIRRGRHKLSFFHGDDRGELFDMEADPREERNLWDDPGSRELRAHLTERLLDWELRQELANDARGGQALPGPEQRIANALRRPS